MPILKPISGHTDCGGVKKYLTKDNRPLATDLINLMDYDWAGRDWAQQMDFTREVAGNNESTNGLPARTYNHYILSPDPRDNMTLEQLREICVAWTEKYLPDFEAAIVYHDDNENGIIHAHLVVNNTNLETGKRLAPFLTKKYVREMGSGLQEMAKERSFHNFVDKGHADRGEAISPNGFHGVSFNDRDVMESVALAPKSDRDGIAFTNQRDYKSKVEREIIAEHNWSWKEDIRARVTSARNLAVDESDFIAKCEDMDLKVKRARNGDYLFVHPEKDTWQCRGGTLGAAYRRDTVIRELQADARTGAPKPHERQYQSIKRNLDTMREGKMRKIAYVDAKSGITLKDIADALETNRRFSIYTEADYKDVAEAHPKDYALHARLDTASRISAEAHLLDYAVRSALKPKPIPAPKAPATRKVTLAGTQNGGIAAQQKAQRIAAQKRQSERSNSTQKRRSK